MLGFGLELGFKLGYGLGFKVRIRFTEVLGLVLGLG